MTEGYCWQPIGMDDAEAWAELTNHLAVVDGTEEFYHADDRLEELQDPTGDPQWDTIAVWSGRQMVGFGTVSARANPDRQGRVRVGIDGGVHPDHRGRGIGTAVMERVEARGAQLVGAHHAGRAFHFDTGGGLADSSARAFHITRGYEVARHFHLMSLPLTRSDPAPNAPDPPLPDGAVLRAPVPQDEQAVLAAHTAAFADHWGSAPPSAARWHEQWNSRSNRFRASRIAVDSTGAVLAYALCGQWLEGELYVNLLGTIPAARGQGVGSAVLRQTLHAAGNSGDYSVVELDVDSDSPTGATRLYERLGFTVKHTTALMRKYPPAL